MEDYVNFKEACRRGGFTWRGLIRRIAAAGVQTHVNGMDKRERLIKVSDLPKLQKARPA